MSAVQQYYTKLDDIEDPWGLGFKIVTKKLKSFAASSLMDEEEAKTVVDALFPTHLTRVDQEDDINVDNIPDFTQEELFAAVDSLRNKKLPAQTAYQPRLKK